MRKYATSNPIRDRVSESYFCRIFVDVSSIRSSVFE